MFYSMADYKILYSWHITLCQNIKELDFCGKEQSKQWGVSNMYSAEVSGMID